MYRIGSDIYPHASGYTPDFSPFQFSVFTCDIPAPATPSGIMAATVEIASGSAQAIADGIYSLWFPLVFMLMLVAVIIGTYIYKK